MREGIELLDDPNALNAFQLAHEVMIRQMMHSSSGLGGGLHSQGNAPAMPENYSADTQKATSRNGEAFSWRPFQLGYILLCLSSLSCSCAPFLQGHLLILIMNLIFCLFSKITVMIVMALISRNQGFVRTGVHIF